MILRLFMIMIRPSDALLKKKKPDGFERFRKWTYQRILKRLLKSYAHYAVSDTIEIADRKVSVRHEYRDLEFESELRRNKIDFLPKMKTEVLPVSTEKSRRTSRFGYFRFTDSLYLKVDGKDLCIRHDDVFSLSGTLKNKARCSSGTDGIIQSATDILLAQTRASGSDKVTFADSVGKSGNPSKSAGPAKPQRKSRPGLFAAEKERPVEPVEPVKQPPVEEVVAEQPKMIGRRGFEIDTSF